MSEKSDWSDWGSVPSIAKVRGAGEVVSKHALLLP
jgi:hypothetical protein